MYDTVWPQRHFSRFLRGRQRRVNARKIRPRDATALARAAVVARFPATMIHGKHRTATDHRYSLAIKVLAYRVAHNFFRTVQLHRRQHFAVRQMRQAQSLARNADEVFHILVPRSDIGIADGPINSDSLAQICFEVEIAPTISLPAPHNGAASDLPPANPAKRLVRRSRIRIFRVVDEEFRRPLIARVACALNRLIFQLPLAVSHAAKLNLPGGNMFHEVELRSRRAPGLEPERLQTLLRQFLRSPAAAHSRSDHDRVIRCLFAHGGLRLLLRSSWRAAFVLLGNNFDMQLLRRPRL